MPDKLTDKEIVKALECCSTYHDVSSCKNCPLDGKCEPNMLEQYSLDLINRLKTENKELKSAINSFRGYEDKIKAEAYKEFAERLKEKAHKCFMGADKAVTISNIDNLLKELVGDSDEVHNSAPTKN